MPQNKSGSSILRNQTIGFSVIITLTWVAEIVRLPHILYGDPVEFHWPRVLMRTLLIGGIWLWVHLATRKLLKRLRHLEEFMLVCSWCRKVGQEGEWLTLEQYVGSHYDTQTSHGVCPECAQKARERLAQQIKEAGVSAG